MVPKVRTKDGKTREFDYSPGGIAAAKREAAKPGAKAVAKKGGKRK